MVIYITSYAHPKLKNLAINLREERGRCRKKSERKRQLGYKLRTSGIKSIRPSGISITP